MEVRFIASESSTNHIMLISLPKLSDDPLKDTYIDEMNLAILKHYGASLFSRINGDNLQEICIEL